MKSLVIYPTELKGEIKIPSSKSIGHREIICSGLACGESIIDNVSVSKDIEATINGLRSFGAKIEEISSKYVERKAFSVKGIGGKINLENNIIDCKESGSTLRFLIPLGILSDEKIIFTGGGKLGERPLDPYFDIFKSKGIEYKTFDEKKNLPLEIKGTLKAGNYSLVGNVSSQFISGLLFALPLCNGDSSIEITTKLESESYINLTLDALKKYGIEIINEDHKKYFIKGNQKYKNIKTFVEGDYSQGAFWLVAGALSENIKSIGLNINSNQGDKKIIDILKDMNVNLKIFENEIISVKSETRGTIIDASDCPDIVPILAVLASVSDGTTKIINAQRLRYKECDRLTAIATELNKIGARIQEFSDGLIINGKKSLNGGEVFCWNDHRIAMSLAIASIKCNEKLILRGTECVEKSYPEFWKDFESLGGKIEEI